jgi:DNA repair protein RecO (recombination protein O)
MEIKGNAIILKKTKFQERGLIISLLTQEHGVIKGLAKTYSSKKEVKLFEGDLVHFNWNARLKEHLGLLKLETQKQTFPNILNEKIRVHILQSTLGIIERVFKENDPIENIYSLTLSLLSSLVSDDIRTCLENYVLFELTVLQESGFGLDLSKCAATQKTDNLIYISPRSGCAVSEEAGEIYKNKLFSLPSFLKDSNISPSVREIFETLKITEHFLNKFLTPFVYGGFEFRAPIANEVEKILDKAL